MQYGVGRETGRVDMDEVREIALRERPKIIFCGGTAIPRTIDFPAFAEIAREVDAVLVADIAHIAGLIAGGAHPSPVGHAGVISTTTHKTLRGPRGAMLMCDEQYAKAIDKAVFPGLQGGPHNHTTAAIAVALHEAQQPTFRDYAAAIVTEREGTGRGASSRGFDLVSGGTDNHLILLDLTPQGVAGKPVAKALDRAGLVVNYNTRALRHPQAVRPVGHPTRHAGGDQPRHGRRRDAADRRLDRRGRRRRGQGRRRRRDATADRVEAEVKRTHQPLPRARAAALRTTCRSL